MMDLAEAYREAAAGALERFRGEVEASFREMGERFEAALGECVEALRAADGEFSASAEGRVVGLERQVRGAFRQFVGERELPRVDPEFLSKDGPGPLDPELLSKGDMLPRAAE